MPIYEYECTQCGKIEEVLQKFSDKPLRKCRHCSGKLHKLVSQSTFHLKGTGWYVTDYANKSNRNSANPSKQPETTSSDTSSSTPKKEKTKKTTQPSS
jgi:putative FmdB family regulatory protein